MLDADFISKMYDIRSDINGALIEKVLDLPYDICCCHSRIVEEIRKNNKGGTIVWLDNKIKNNEIVEYTDKWILYELFNVLSNKAISYYVRLLESIFDNFKDGMFKEVYVGVRSLDYDNVDIDEFIETMNKDEEKIQTDYNLGEIKTFVLIHILQLKYNADIMIFCSDDNKARNSIVRMADVKCLSVLSSFLRLLKENKLKKEEAKPYVNSYLNLLNNVNQKQFKIQDVDSRVVRVDCREVLDGIFNNKFVELKNGMLRYRNLD